MIEELVMTEVRERAVNSDGSLNWTLMNNFPEIEGGGKLYFFFFKLGD